MPTPVKQQTWITNSDRVERQQFKVIKRTPNSRVKGIKVDDREFRFGQGNMFVVDDPGLAHEIHDNHGQGGDGDVMVVPVEKKAQPGHVRTLTGLAMPWHNETFRFGHGNMEQ